jgi:hypothetical protein
MGEITMKEDVAAVEEARGGVAMENEQSSPISI